MARAIREGFDYFPLDTDAYGNRKIRRLLHAHGCTGYAVWVVAMQMIYGDKGYYLKFDDDMCFDIGDKVAVSEGAVHEILKYCLKLDLFDQHSFQKYGILTSKGIQEQFEEMVRQTKRKTVVKAEHRINSEEKHINSEEMGINSEETPKKSELMQQSKVKESKVKENKVNNSTTTINNNLNIGESHNDVQKQNVAAVEQNAIAFYQQNFGVANSYLIDQIMQWVSDLSHELVIAAMKIALDNKAQFSYAKAVLNNWANQNITTIEQARAYELNRKRNKSKFGKHQREEVVPSWAKELPDNAEKPVEQLSAEREEELRNRLAELFEMSGDDSDG
ncbi:DUF4373 domain-containing protein [Aerococcaceae bacterium zg-ZJ1578]|uniref:Lin1244/Lin1753 domain-containing protein n=1 Tax=Aerococcaceae bacterium zg-252 TaxID=2796928 RepID=UPI001A1F19B7|nr:DUF4373 domain-containing protein [Aerococcaceae bacterium zg-1578]